MTEAFNIENLQNFKQQMLHWGNQFNVCCFLDNNDYPTKNTQFDSIAAMDVKTSLTIKNEPNGLALLDAYLKQKKNWAFGHLNYDFRDVIFNKKLSKNEIFAFPNAFFYEPNIIIKIKGKLVTIMSYTLSPKEIFKLINNSEIIETTTQIKIKVKPIETKKSYLNKIKLLKNHIQKGDCYEINYCQAFVAKNVVISPTQLFWKLSKKSPTPFATFYKYYNSYVIGASPERFIQKEGNNITSQPIKGTIKKVQNEQDDAVQINTLKQSEKDKSENVMVVDMVRNDLSQICTKGSVIVNELFGIYSFSQVHQMISTISGNLLPNLNFANIVEKTFPMGSMTGAPKKKVMQLINQYECMHRGIYSGCMGYINDANDFDFNVVIRSIIYDKTTQQLGYMVGGGITNYSDPQNEYEECLLKAKAMDEILANI